MSELPDKIRQFYVDAALPAEVVERLAAAGRRARRQRMIGWGSLAAAAAVALLVWTGVGKSSPKLTAESIDEQVSKFFSRPDARLEFASPDPSEVRAWLEKRHGPSDFKIPPGLLGKATVGCEILDSEDQCIFIICFLESESRMATSDTAQPHRGPAIVHLVLAPKKAFAVLPPATFQPPFRAHNGWTFAAWTDGEHVYLLTTDAGVEPLHRALKV